MTSFRIYVLLCLVAISQMPALVVAATWTMIDAPELQRWLRQIDPPLLLDIRGGEVYSAGTMPEALNTGKDPKGFLADGRGGRVVLITSQPIDDGLLSAWVKRLKDARHEVFVLKGGMPAWEESGGAVIIPQQIYVKPGTVPFVIPKGLCEGDEPAQEYE